MKIKIKLNEGYLHSLVSDALKDGSCLKCLSCIHILKHPCLIAPLCRRLLSMQAAQTFFAEVRSLNNSRGFVQEKWILALEWPLLIGRNST